MDKEKNETFFEFSVCHIQIEKAINVFVSKAIESSKTYEEAIKAIEGIVVKNSKTVFGVRPTEKFLIDESIKRIQEIALKKDNQKNTVKIASGGDVKDIAKQILLEINRGRTDENRKVSSYLYYYVNDDGDNIPVLRGESYHGHNFSNVWLSDEEKECMRKDFPEAIGKLYIRFNEMSFKVDF